MGLVWAAVASGLLASFSVDLAFRAVGAVSSCPDVPHPGQTADPIVERRIAAALLQPPHASVLAESLHAMGYQPRGGAEGVFAELPGTVLPGEMLVVRAGEGQSERGARAVLFAMAGLLSGRPARRTIQFHWGRASAGEGAPRDPGAAVRISLSELGEGVTGRPVAPLGWLYDPTSVKLSFVGEGEARGLVNVLASRFRYHSDVPSVCEKRHRHAPWAIPVAPRARQGEVDVLVVDWVEAAEHAASSPGRLAKIAQGLAEAVRDLADFDGKT